jgi:hypothetical protein
MHMTWSKKRGKDEGRKASIEELTERRRGIRQEGCRIYEAVNRLVVYIEATGLATGKRNESSRWEFSSVQETAAVHDCRQDCTSTVLDCRQYNETAWCSSSACSQ